VIRRACWSASNIDADPEARKQRLATPDRSGVQLSDDDTLNPASVDSIDAESEPERVDRIADDWHSPEPGHEESSNRAISSATLHR
jgi:hypothetical protein